MAVVKCLKNEIATYYITTAYLYFWSIVPKKTLEKYICEWDQKIKKVYANLKIRKIDFQK